MSNTGGGGARQQDRVTQRLRSTGFVAFCFFILSVLLLTLPFVVEMTILDVVYIYIIAVFSFLISLKAATSEP